MSRCMLYFSNKERRLMKPSRKEYRVSSQGISAKSLRPPRKILGVEYVELFLSWQISIEVSHEIL